MAADKHTLLSSQFTQSALDCMSVEVGRLRAFLQVRAHQICLSALFFLVTPSSPPALMLAWFLIHFLF